MKQIFSVNKISKYFAVSLKFLKLLDKPIMANTVVTWFQKTTTRPDLYL